MSDSLQSEVVFLRQQLETLLREAQRNHEKLRRFDQIERRLIGAPSLPDLIERLLYEYKQEFAIDFVSLSLVDSGNEVEQLIEDRNGAPEFSGLMLLPTSDSLEPLYPDGYRPHLCDFDLQQHHGVFVAPLGGIASVALLPLVRHGRLIGSLHFGSAHPDRYGSDYGTDFLERLAEVAAICLESALAQERLKQAGLTDVLTGVQNRRYFDHRCLVEISQARRYGYALACMFLDIDYFKRINDTHGHLVGDEVLRHIAGDIQTQLRSGDTMARYGGEEFVVLLPQTELHHARQIAERIRCRINEKVFQAPSGQRIKLSISIGLSMLPEKDESSIHEPCQLAAQLLAASDRALYCAKRGGRNRVEWTPQRQGQEKKRMSLLQFFAKKPGV